MIPEHPETPAERDLKRLWFCVHAYLQAQAMTHTVEGAAALGRLTGELYELVNELHGKWIELPPPALVPAGGTLWAEALKGTGSVDPTTGRVVE